MFGRPTNPHSIPVTEHVMKNLPFLVRFIIPIFWLGCLTAASAAADVPVDLSGYSTACGIRVEQHPGTLSVQWPLDDRVSGQLDLNITGKGRLIESVRVTDDKSDSTPILTDVDLVVEMTVGTRVAPPGQPPGHWQVFFDNPHRRPHSVVGAKVHVERVRVTSHGKRITVAMDAIEADPFRGALELTFYHGCSLVRVDFVMRTTEDRLAILYNAGLTTDRASWRRFVWIDTTGQLRKADVEENSEFRPLMVRHRTLAVESDHGTVTCFSPTHQYQFPRDYTDNLKYVWYGKTGQEFGGEFGFGIRQNKDGGGNFVPWFNAPPHVPHRLGMFLLISRGDGQQAVQETLRFTQGDRFPKLPGYITMTSHWHMAITVMAMEELRRGIVRHSPPDYVRIFKDLGVQIVHLGEFHGDGHQKDPGPLRLPELQAMFRECKRWSDDELLLVPGEEVNTFLGMELEGKHPGHWMSLFPRPVYWIMNRAEDQPFLEDHPEFGKVYRVGGRADMIRLIKEERALVWAAHPRIKASSWTPDIFRNEDFFLADYWLGGAWKAMPADLSRERLGERVLDLVDDMANWGNKKYVLGEVDVFKIDPTHELYGHMNVNYLHLASVPRFDDGWQPLLDTLRDGRFFVTTGEVLLPEFTVGGKRSGEIYPVQGQQPVEVSFDVRWTFPLAFAELISGDGQKVYRQRLDLDRTGPFGHQTIKIAVDLRGRRWARLEVWDIAANGAFTQPVWLAGD